MFFFDAPFSSQFWFQDTATSTMERIIDLHNEIMVFLVFIFFFVTWVLVRSVYLFRETNTSAIRFAFQHNSAIEQIWTIVPAIILLVIALPSCSLLYLTDEISSPLVTVKITGYQWYWNYKLADYLNIQFDSYLLQEDNLTTGQFRLLSVDNALFLPTNIPIRILTTSADVIHSWALPSAGIKIDAIPGRNNQNSLYLLRPGSFYGQCSELCGINHAFMPIKVVAIPLRDWLIKNYLYR